MPQFDLDRRAFGTGLAAGAAFISAGAGEAAAQEPGPVARTRYGQVQGFRRNGAEIFLGLPYGASTDGERRFMPPQPPAAWMGTRDATRLGQRAPQGGQPIYRNMSIGQYMSGGRAEELIALAEPMGEDCLVLNVLTPRSDQRGRPVMVYLHGGGFRSGSGAVHTLGDRFVAEEDVVLVTVNHRLSQLGFLYLGGLSPRYAQGNPSMLDLLAALRWVKDNIAGFGGDPAKVTIFGESGGGVKVALLMGMPQAGGLFRAAIIESGLRPAPTAPDAATAATRALLTQLNVTPNDLAKLHSLPFTSFVGGGAAASGPVDVPVADGRTLVAAPWGAGAPAISADIPLIVGTCKDESTLFIGTAPPDPFSLDWASASAKLATLTQRSEAAMAPAIAAYRAVYPTENPSDIFFRMASIFGIGHDGRLFADAKALQSAPVYYYRMEYETGIAPGLRAFHTCELPLATRMVAQPRAEGLSKQIAGAWAAFARTGGDPNHPGLPHWGRYRPGGTGPLMIFDLNTRVVPDPEEKAQTMLRAVLA